MTPASHVKDLSTAIDHNNSASNCCRLGLDASNINESLTLRRQSATFSHLQSHALNNGFYGCSCVIRGLQIMQFVYCLLSVEHDAQACVSTCVLLYASLSLFT